MNYATVQDMVDRFGELELIQLTAGAAADAVIDTDKVERALADAQAWLDGFVGAVYRLPLAGCAKPASTPENPAAVALVPPPQLVRWACDVARYYLHDQVAPEHEVFVRFKSAQRDLEALAAGKAVLACPWGGQPGVQLAGSEPGESEVVHGFARRQITDDSTAGFR
jgi:phage gp36-like protein